MRTISTAALTGAMLPLALAAAAQERPDSATPVEPIVSVARVPNPATAIPFGITLLRGDEIGRAGPGLSLSGALATVPGVTTQNRFNAARDERIVIRGFGARAAFGLRGVRVLLDGIPQTLPDGQSQLTNVDLQSIERIEVLRGSSSALYGNAAGGVIALSSGDVVGTRTVPTWRVLGGAYGLLAANIGVAAPVGTAAVAVRGSLTRTDGYRDLSRTEQWRGSVRGVIPVGPATRVIAVVHLADLPLAEDPGTLTATELADDPRQASPNNVAVGATETVFQGQGGVTLEHAWSGGGRLQATAYGMRRDLRSVLSFATIALDRWAFGTRTAVTVPVAPSLSADVTVGADAQWQRDDRMNLSPDGAAVTRDQFETVREVGPFAQVRFRPVRQLAVTAGARYDDVAFDVRDRLVDDGDDSGRRSMNALSGTVGLAVIAHPAVNPYASVGTSFEAPTTTELVNRPDGSGGFNPSLEPQRATQFEVGVRGHVGVLSYSAAAYQADVRDALIPFEVPGGSGRRFFRNAGESRHRGLELGATVRPLPGVRLTGAYTHVDLRFVDFASEDGDLTDNEIPGVPARFASAAVAVRHGIVSVDMEARAASSFFVDDANTTRNDSWWVADLRVAADVATDELRLYVGLENLFAERYVEAVVTNAGFGRYFEPAPGRTVYVGAELTRRQGG